jgi:NIMA (never in mitosis gene a)-related kinase 1/4/5
MQSEGTSLKDFIVVDKLGTGSFSSVYKVQRIDDKNYYAMKKVNIHSRRSKSIK